MKKVGQILWDKVRVYYDRTGNTLSVWFDDPAKESVCRVIGFERLNYLSRKKHEQGNELPVEVRLL